MLMRFQARIKYPADLRLLLEETSDLHRAFILLADAEVERLHSRAITDRPDIGSSAAPVISR